MTFRDRRNWMETDRPGERIALSMPCAGVRVLSAKGSDRPWSEFHEMHTICVVDRGQTIAAEWRCGRSGTLTTGAGELMLMEIGSWHRTARVVGGKASFSVVQIPTPVVDEVRAELGIQTSLTLSAGSSRNLALFEAVQDFVSSEALGAESLELECKLRDLIRIWLRTRGAQPSGAGGIPHPGVRRAREAIRDRFSKPETFTEAPSLDELAKVSGLSASHFSRAFRQWTGLSPHRYLNLCRLSAGRRLLEQGASATDAAAALGFSDLAHFSNSFRKEFGITPSEYIRRLGPGRTRPIVGA